MFSIGIVHSYTRPAKTLKRVQSSSQELFLDSLNLGGQILDLGGGRLYRVNGSDQSFHLFTASSSYKMTGHSRLMYCKLTNFKQSQPKSC